MDRELNALPFSKLKRQTANSMWSFPAVIVLLTVVIVGIHDVNGAVSRGKVESNNGNCVDKDGNEHAAGETWFGDGCTRHSCSKIGDNYYEEVAGCGSLGVGPGCHLEEGSGDYPDCCPQVVCDGEERKKRGKYADYETQY